jgi:glycosyltransferase involved in cell wall biosynthesis
MGALVGASDMTVLPLQTMRDKVDIPTTLLESLAASKPIVITDLPPMVELLHESNGEAGMAIQPGDSKSLSMAIIELLKDVSARHEMGLRGQQLVSDQYNIRHVSQQYEKLYKDLLCSHPLAN